MPVCQGSHAAAADVEITILCQPMISTKDGYLTLHEDVLVLCALSGLQVQIFNRLMRREQYSKACHHIS